MDNSNYRQSGCRLCATYQGAGRLDEAIELAELVLAQRVEVLGDTHPNTAQAQANLKAMQQQASE